MSDVSDRSDGSDGMPVAYVECFEKIRFDLAELKSYMKGWMVVVVVDGWCWFLSSLKIGQSRSKLFSIIENHEHNLPRPLMILYVFCLCIF